MGGPTGQKTLPQPSSSATAGASSSAVQRRALGGTGSGRIGSVIPSGNRPVNGGGGSRPVNGTGLGRGKSVHGGPGVGVGIGRREGEIKRHRKVCLFYSFGGGGKRRGLEGV